MNVFQQEMTQCSIVNHFILFNISKQQECDNIMLLCSLCVICASLAEKHLYHYKCGIYNKNCRLCANFRSHQMIIKRIIGKGKILTLLTIFIYKNISEIRNMILYRYLYILWNTEITNETLKLILQCRLNLNRLSRIIYPKLWDVRKLSIISGSSKFSKYKKVVAISKILKTVKIE